MTIKDVYKHSWEEVSEAIKNGQKLKSIDGLPFQGLDDFQLWAGSVRVAQERGKRVPKHILQDFYTVGGFGIWPKDKDLIIKRSLLDVVPEPVINSAHNAHDTVRAKPVAEVHKVVLNRKGKPFSWSFSSISEFLICPMKHAGSKFYCDVPFQESEALRWGNYVHQCLEDRITKGTPLPEAIKSLEKYVTAFLASGGNVVAEKEFAVNRDWELVGYFSKGPKGAWGRCKVDVHIDLGKHVPIYDYKTGKVPKMEKDLQLDISALFISLVLPDAEIYIPKFIYTAHDLVTPTNKLIQKSELPGIKSRVEGYIAQMEECWATEVFKCTPNGLCRQYCGVHSCEHNGQYGR